MLRNPTSINIFINTFGQYINIGFVVIYTLILFRILNPTEYGIFSVLTTVTYVLTNILDFGTTATIYSYLPPLVEDKGKNLFKFIKSTFYYQTIFATIVIIALLFLYPTLDQYFFKTGATYLEMAISAITVMLFIWQNFLLNVYFAAKKFLKANYYINVSNVVRIIGLAIIYFGNLISIPSVMFVLMVVGNVTFIILVFLEKRSYLKEALDAKVSREEFRFKYTLTYFVASQFLNLGLRMDLFIISFFNLIITRPEVGFYAAAQKIVLTLLTTIISITQVLSPGFTQIKNQKEAREQLKHGFLYMLLPSALYIGVVITPGFIYEMFFTSAFSQSALIARILSLPFILYALGSVPMLLLLYTVKKPKPILVAYTAFVIIVVTGNYLFVPVYKVYAPPFVFLLAFVVSSAYMAFEAWKEYKKLPSR